MSTAATRKSLFLAYCPDYPDNLATRLKCRAEHLARAQEDKKTGVSEFGRAFLPSPSSPLRTSPLLPPNTQGMAGSVMMFRLPTLDDAWKRIKEDAYWTGGVWDKEKVIIEEFCVPPGEPIP